MRTIKHCPELSHICLLLKQSTQEPFSGYSKYDLCQSNVVCFCLCHSFFFFTYSCIAEWQCCITLQSHRVFLALFLPWDVFFTGSYCHTAVFIPGCFIFRVTAQCFVVQTTTYWIVNSDFGGSRKPPAEWCVFYTAACLSFLKVRHEGKTHHQHAWEIL